MLRGIWRWLWWGGAPGEDAAAAPTHTGGRFVRRDPARLFTRGGAARRFARRGDPGRRFRSDPRMATIPVITLAKDTSETVSYLFDYSNFPELIDGDTISSASVPAVAGLTIGSPAVTAAARDGVAAGKGVAVTISGGTASTTYDVECHATMASGAIRTVKGKIQVE